ncbi:MAG: glycosyltransferase family 2 protein [Hyphomicrobium sp.]|uniref:glycosyltransferase family 2 protein n=1 Tax=Hyphomicrobium sp. TaxID=82 RepID=UPI003D0FF126
MSSIDVIVPCYRYAHYLRQCVESVLDQEGVDVRVLILDDASPDHTPEVGQALAREDKRVTYVRHAVNKKHIATYNEGIDWISADYYLLLSADDYLLPGALARAAALLDARPDVGFVFGNANELQEDGTESRMDTFGDGSGDRVVSGEEFIEINWPYNAVPTPTAVVRTSLQKEVGGYRPELPHAGDMEMWMRLAARAPVGMIDAAQAVYRRHASNMSYAYFRQSRLPDLEQRQLVAEGFLASSGPLLRDPEGLRRRMFRALSLGAVGYASSAFNDGDLDLSERFTKAARSLYPGVWRTLPWAKLRFKRLFGQKVWRAMQPAAEVLRLAAGRRR